MSQKQLVQPFIKLLLGKNIVNQKTLKYSFNPYHKIVSKIVNFVNCSTKDTNMLNRAWIVDVVFDNGICNQYRQACPKVFSCLTSPIVVRPNSNNANRWSSDPLLFSILIAPYYVAQIKFKRSHSFCLSGSSELCKFSINLNCSNSIWIL